MTDKNKYFFKLLLMNLLCTYIGGIIMFTVLYFFVPSFPNLDAFILCNVLFFIPLMSIWYSVVEYKQKF